MLYVPKKKIPFLLLDSMITLNIVLGVKPLPIDLLKFEKIIVRAVVGSLYSRLL